VAARARTAQRVEEAVAATAAAEAVEAPAEATGTGRHPTLMRKVRRRLARWSRRLRGVRRTPRIDPLQAGAVQVSPVQVSPAQADPAVASHTG